MNQNRHTLLWTTLIFFSTFYAWHNTVSSTIAESIANPSKPNLVKEEPQPKSEKNLPLEVQSAVIEAASQQTSRTVSSLIILNSQPKEWSDGCLGLTEPGKVCVQNVVSGWQVEVSDGLRNWTFRTDETGDLVKLEESAE
jgi:hypothetical protein